MPKKLTQDKIKQLEENANMMMANGSSEEEILSMSNQFMEQFGVEDTIEKKKSTPSPIQPQSQSVLSQATNGLFGNATSPKQNTTTEQSSGQSSTRGISLLRGKSVKPIEAQQGKVEEKKRDRQDVISYASNKLANVFARGDEGIKQELIPNIEKELQSGNHGDVYDYFETKKVDDDFVKNASPIDIVQSANSKAEALKNSPQELAVYETTKESKIANHILDIQNGNKIGERDVEYLKQNAPIAYKDMLRSVEQYNTDFPIQNINTVAEINKKKVDANSQIQGAKNIQQSVQAFSGIIPEDMLGMGVINSKLKGVKDTYANELKKLEEQYPIETETVKVAGEFDTRIKPRPQEYIEAKQELEQKRDELLGKAGVLEAVYHGKKNPNVNDVELGKKFLEVQSPTMYSLYQKAGNSKGFEADLAKMGIDVMLNSGDPNLIAKGKEYKRTFDDRYPEWAERDLQRKIGIEYFKKEGVNTISNPNAISVREADKLIDQFSDKEMKVYSKMKDRLMKESGFAGDKANWAKIPIPNAGGLVNSLVEGAFMPIAGTYNLLANISETDQQKAQRALTPQSIASEKVFEKDQINREIESLLKKDKLNIMDAKKLSELYTEQSLKTDAQRFGDASLLVAGQVLSQGGFGRLLGAGTSTLVGGSASALKGLGYIAKAERVAELANNMNAMSNFGNATFSFLSTYDDASLEIERIAPDANPLFKSAYATTIGLLNAGTEHIFPDVKIFDVFRREVAPEIASLVTNLSTGSITEEIFRRSVSTILKKSLPKYLGNVVKSDVKEGIEEATAEGGKTITQLVGVALGQIDPSQVNIEESVEAVGQVFNQTVVDGLFVAGVMGRVESLRSRTTQRALYELATNQQQLDGFIDAVKIQQESGKMSVSDATDKIKTAITLNKVATEIIPALEKRITLNDNQKIALTSLLTLEKKLENDLSNPQNSGIKSVIESQLADVRNKKEGILKGEYIVDENFNALTPDELKQKVQEEKQSDEELKKSISKVNTNPSFVIIEETDGTFSVLIDNEKKEEGFKTKEEASQRVLKLNGIQFEQPSTTLEPNKVVERDGIAIELPSSQVDLQTTQNTPQNEQETIEATNTEVATDIGQQPSNAPIQEENTEDVTQSEIGIHESTKGVMNGMNVNIERKDDGNYIYTMLGDKIPFTKEQHDELVASKELIITKGKEVTKIQTPEVKVEQQPTTSSESDIESKKADIEKRRQEELESTDLYQYDIKFKYFQTYGTTVKEAFDNLFEQVKNNPTNKKLSDLLDYINDRLVPEDIIQDSNRNPLVQEYIDDNQQNIDKANKSTKSRQAKINAKYDAELKALEQPKNEGKGTKELPSEPIQPKGDSKGKDKEGVGEAVQQGSKGTDNAVAGTTTSILEEGASPILSKDEKKSVKDFLKLVETRQSESKYQNMDIEGFKTAYNNLPKSVKDFISSNLKGKIRAYEGELSDSETPSFSNQFIPQLFGKSKVRGEQVESNNGTIDTKKLVELADSNNIKHDVGDSEGEVIVISPKFKNGAESNRGALYDYTQALVEMDSLLGDDNELNKEIRKERRRLDELLDDRKFYNDLANSDNVFEVLKKYNIDQKYLKQSLSKAETPKQNIKQNEKQQQNEGTDNAVAGTTTSVLEEGSVGVGGEPKDITNELNKQTFDVGDKVTVRGKEYTVYKPQEGRFVYLETPRGAKKILKVDSNILVKDDKFQTSEEKFLWNKGDVIHTKLSLKEQPKAETNANPPALKDVESTTKAIGKLDEDVIDDLKSKNTLDNYDVAEVEIPDGIESEMFWHEKLIEKALKNVGVEFSKQGSKSSGSTYYTLKLNNGESFKLRLADHKQKYDADGNIQYGEDTTPQELLEMLRDELPDGKILKSTDVATEYHKQKSYKNITNPELVKAVEELLKEQPKAETPKQNIKQNEKQQQQNEGINNAGDGGIQPTPITEEGIKRREEEIAREEEGIAKRESELGTNNQRLATDDIIANPKVFQYKESDESTSGTNYNERLEGKFDEDLAGSIGVWVDKKNELGGGEGKVYVVDGHHRLEFAKRSGKKDVNVYYIQAENSKDARVKGAMANIAQGRGTAIDSAKVFRDGNIEDLKNFNPKSAIGKQGKQLAKLNDDLFTAVSNGKIPMRVAVALSYAPKEIQSQLGKLVMKVANNPNISDAGLSRFVKDRVEEYKRGDVSKGNTLSLFGDEEVLNFAEQATLEEAVIKEIEKDAKLLGSASKNSDVLENANSQIDTDATKQASKNLKTAIGLYETFRSRKSINSIVKEYTDKLKSANKKDKVNLIKEATTKVIDAVNKELQSQIGGDVIESDTDISKSITKLSELSNKIDNAQTTSEARKAKEDYDNELKKDSKLNFIITNFTSITDQLENLKLITKKGDC